MQFRVHLGRLRGSARTEAAVLLLLGKCGGEEAELSWGREGKMVRKIRRPMLPKTARIVEEVEEDGADLGREAGDEGRGKMNWLALGEEY